MSDSRIPLADVPGNQARPGSENAHSPGRASPLTPVVSRTENPRPMLASSHPLKAFLAVTPVDVDTARLPSQVYCGKGSIIGCSPDRSHVVIIPMRCKSWDCPHCGPRKRRDWIHKFMTARPDREITLTCPKDKWPNPMDAAWHMKKAWTKLVHRIRRKYGPFEYGLVWELTKAGTPHLHILSRGSYIPQKWLKLQWVSLGIGSIIHISSVKNAGLHAAHLCKYLAKDTGQTAASLAPMRIVQVSKGFLLGEPPPTTEDAYPGYAWVFTSQSPSESLKPFLESVRYLDVQHGDDGVVDVYLDADPPPSDLADAPELWAGHPLLLCAIEHFARTARLPLSAPPDSPIPSVPVDRGTACKPLAMWPDLPPVRPWDLPPLSELTLV